jgi:hypothetical protein
MDRNNGTTKERFLPSYRKPVPIDHQGRADQRRRENVLPTDWPMQHRLAAGERCVALIAFLLSG